MSETLEISALLPSYVVRMRSQKRSERTIELTEKYVDRLQRWLADEGLSDRAGDVSNRVLERYLVHLGATLSATTVGIHYRTLRAFFRWLADEEEIDRSPFDRMRQPKADEKPVPVFTPQDLDALLATTTGRDFVNRRDRAILFTFIDTGVRLGELLSMSTDALVDDMRLAEVDGKTGPRFVQFGVKAWEAIDRYRRSRSVHPHVDADAFWLGAKGPLSGSGVAQMLKRRGREAGVPDVHPHRFRHTFAHEWLATGGQEHDLVQLAGWTSPQMVARYGRSAAAARAMAAKDRNSPGDRL